MQWLSPFLLTIQVLTSLSIIVLVLLQQGKGADMGSSFGSGSAGSLFGSAGAANFLSRTTRWVAIVFFAATIGLAYASHNTGRSVLDGGLMQNYQPETPASGNIVPDSFPEGSSSSVPNLAPAQPPVVETPADTANHAGNTAQAPN